MVAVWQDSEQMGMSDITIESRGEQNELRTSAMTVHRPDTTLTSPGSSSNTAQFTVSYSR